LRIDLIRVAPDFPQFFLGGRPRARGFAIGMIAILLLSKTPIGWATDTDFRPFTIKDSIEMSYIVDSAASTAVEIRGAYPPGGPLLSPDGERILLVTQRGIVSTNSLEATIWLFDRKAVSDYVVGKSALKPLPSAIARYSAPSNTPVISDVRWLEDSSRVAFLAKNDSPYQQLFVADTRAGSVISITKNDVYVSAYDIHGDTIVYSTLMMDEPYSTLADIQIDRASGDELVNVAGKNLYYLLYPNRQSIKDIDEAELLFYPNTLHLQIAGREVPITFTFEGKPLRLVIPTLSLSPDGRSLITVAAVNELPAGWAAFEPVSETLKKFTLNSDHQRDLDVNDPHRASQYILVDLKTGMVSPLVSAPAGRCLYWYIAPTNVTWSADSRKAILSNTFLPIDGVGDEKEKIRRHQAPVVAEVDTTTHDIQRVAALVRPPAGAKEEDVRVTRIKWNEIEHQVEVIYDGRKEPAQGPRIEIYRLNSGQWAKTATAESDTSGDNIDFSVDQDLNHPPVLMAHVRGTLTASAIWNPNPQLERVSLGAASLHQWQDRNGRTWSGVLAVPPNYDSKHRYPLLIQPYGYEPHQFFTDGEFTSSYAGRAASASGIVVLQMAGDSAHRMTPEDGPANLLGFESAIEELSNAGVIDRNRVGVIGFSYTCFYVLYALTHHPDLFAAASIFDGTSMSYVQNVLSTSLGNGLQDTSDAENGGPPFGPTLKTWLERAPGFNLDKVKAPLRMYEFERTALIYDWEIYSGLFRLKKPVDMIWLRKENAPHILVKPHQRYLAQQGNLDWFDFWLQGKEDPDPAKAKQYEFWRELRMLQK
jgi:dipeptidyl aminopeptidase/acylaminoacyl peptidase